MTDLTASDRVRLRYEVMERFGIEAASSMHFEALSNITGRGYDIYIPDKGVITVVADWAYGFKVWESVLRRPRVLQMYWDPYYAYVAEQNHLTPYDETQFFDAIEEAIAWQREAQ